MSIQERRVDVNPFDRLINGKLEQLSGERLTTVGAVSYSKGEKYLLIGLDSYKNVKNYHVGSGEIAELATSDHSGRLINMNGFNNVDAIQVEASEVSFPLEPTQRYGPLIDISIPAKPSNELKLLPDKEQYSAVLDGKEVIDLTLGRVGGVVLFEDQGLPEIPALIIQEDMDGLIVFFEDDRPVLKPTNKQIQGMTMFLTELTNKLSSLHNLNYARYNSEFDSIAKRIQHAQINSTSEFFAAFYKARLAAYNVDAAQGVVKSKNYLERLFPKRGRFSRGADVLDASDVVNYLGVYPTPVFREEQIYEPQANDVEKPHTIFDELKTKKYKRLRMSVEGKINDLYKSGLEELYLAELHKDVFNFDTLNQADDVLTLLDELKKTPTYTNKRVYTETSSGRDYEAYLLIEGMIASAKKKRFKMANSKDY